MRFTITMMTLVFCSNINAMPAYWKDFGLSHGGGFDGTVRTGFLVLFMGLMEKMLGYTQ